MKRVLFAAICLMFLITGSAVANVVDGIYQVHKADYPPTIDGEFDDIWYAASKERNVIPDAGEGGPPDGLLDCFAESWVLWDDDNIYILVKVVDDELSSTSANSYENESVEYYFDGDNSKGAAMDGFDDVQMRIELQDGDDVASYDSFPEGSAGASSEWEAIDGDAFGYIIECSIPLEGINVEYGNIFGFELQINDRDNETRETMLRWWGDNNNAWQQPDLWGEAELIDYVASDILNISQLSSAPDIDGVIDAAWDDAPYIGMGTYVYTNADAVDGSFTEVEEWEDCQLQFKHGWDADNYYLWVEVIDDEISVSGANTYENDGVELCFDGGNEKLEGAYDDNDLQYRWVWGSETNDAGSPASVFAWGELEIDLEGYTFELAIPQEDLLFTLEEGAEIGWEIQINERDNEARENMMRWWGSDNMTWTDAARMGTAVLAGPVAVDQIGQPESFTLSQNYPNPFNPTTNINFNLDRRSQVRLTVYDVLGNMVAELLNDVRSSGAHTVAFDGSELNSGVYFYKLETPREVVTKKMMLLK